MLHNVLSTLQGVNPNQIIIKEKMERGLIAIEDCVEFSVRGCMLIEVRKDCYRLLEEIW